MIYKLITIMKCSMFLEKMKIRRRHTIIPVWWFCLKMIEIYEIGEFDTNLTMTFCGIDLDSYIIDKIILTNLVILASKLPCCIQFFDNSNENSVTWLYSNLDMMNFIRKSTINSWLFFFQILRSFFLYHLQIISIHSKT